MSIFLDIEWLLSTLFDASLLSPSSRRQRRLLFIPAAGFGDQMPIRKRVITTMIAICIVPCAATA